MVKGGSILQNCAKDEIDDMKGQAQYVDVKQILVISDFLMKII